MSNKGSGVRQQSGTGTAWDIRRALECQFEFDLIQAAFTALHLSLIGAPGKSSRRRSQGHAASGKRKKPRPRNEPETGPGSG